MMGDRGALRRVQRRLCLVRASQAGCWRSAGGTGILVGFWPAVRAPAALESFLGTGLGSPHPVSAGLVASATGRTVPAAGAPASCAEPGGWSQLGRTGRLCSIWPEVSVSQARTGSSRGGFIGPRASTTCLGGGLMPSYSGGAVAQTGGELLPREAPRRLHPANSVLGAGRG